MGPRGHPRQAFLRTIQKAAPLAVRTLERELKIDRRTAGEAFAAAAALTLAGLARHQRRRPLQGTAAYQVVKKFGRPADLKAPELGIPAHLARRSLSPRLGGLLGDAGPKAAAWLAARRPGATPEQVGKAMAAVAPLVLGALREEVEAVALTEWLAKVPEAPLEDPAALLAVVGDPSDAFLRLRRMGQSWWERTLGLSG
jgi:hypothetical protein